MTIPIRNLYYLFLYAWARFPGGTLVEAGIDESPDLPNLFAKLLLVGTRRLFRRGLNRGYETFTEEMLGLRGRLRLDRIIKETTQLRGTAICDFDELTHDVLHNQVLKATLKNLAGCIDVENETRHEIRYLIRRFYDVADVRLSANHFRRLSVSRTNREYILLMRVCEFVFWSLLPDETGAGTSFQRVLEDEVRMSAVFEDFLCNFYQLHRTEYDVRAEAQEWDVTDATQNDLAFLPRMITDITLRHPNHTIIIDAKFYKDALVAGPYGKRVRSRRFGVAVLFVATLLLASLAAAPASAHKFFVCRGHNIADHEIPITLPNPPNKPGPAETFMWRPPHYLTVVLYQYWKQRGAVIFDDETMAAETILENTPAAVLTYTRAGSYSGVITIVETPSGGSATLKEVGKVLGITFEARFNCTVANIDATGGS